MNRGCRGGELGVGFPRRRHRHWDALAVRAGRGSGGEVLHSDGDRLRRASLSLPLVAAAISFRGRSGESDPRLWQSH